MESWNCSLERERERERDHSDDYGQIIGVMVGTCASTSPTTRYIFEKYPINNFVFDHGASHHMKF